MTTVDSSLLESYALWISEVRRFAAGNNHIRPEKERQVLQLIYEGRRQRDVSRISGISLNTVRRTLRSLEVFLQENPGFTQPKCACGAAIWHRDICEVWDRERHRAAIRKGHATQRRRFLLKASDEYFEDLPKITEALNQICANNPIREDFAHLKHGQYRRQKERAQMIRELMRFYHDNPGIDYDAIITQFLGRGFNRSALGQLLEAGVSDFSYRCNPEALPMPVRAERGRDDTFFENINTMNTLTTTEPSIQEQALQFAALIQRGIDAWTEAGKLLVQMLHDDPNAKEIILDACPDVTTEILSRFEAIGRGQLHPKTLINNSPGMRRLRQLPFSDQERYLNSPVPVLIRTDTGVDTLNVQVKNLTNEQAMQVFSPLGVRGLDAQRAWIESRRTKRNSGSRQPWTIKGHKVIFRAECEMTARELAELLAKLS